MRAKLLPIFLISGLVPGISFAHDEHNESPDTHVYDMNFFSPELDADTLFLQEVVVTAQKSQMTLDSERRVFNVKSNISSAGASAEELLSAVPSVDVNSEGEVSLHGNPDVMIWINGKAMGMNDDNRSQILRQIPAETIESIEVMSNPSSRLGSEGTAGIINIILKDNHRHGYFGNAEANADSRGTAGMNFNIHYNEGKFQSFAGIGLKTRHVPGGSVSERDYSDGSYLNSDSRIKNHENSAFLRIGTDYRPNPDNTFYISAIGTLSHKWGRTETTHLSDVPGQWVTNLNTSHEKGNNRGGNVLLGYTHAFGQDHKLDLNISYNIWMAENDNNSEENETMDDGMKSSVWRGQHQDVKISNWEAAADYDVRLLPWLRLEAGYKGNYNRENSPASYSAGLSPDNLIPVDGLYNRFKYETDINALYINLAGSHRNLTFAAGLRGEAWEIRTRSLGYGQTDNDVEAFRKNSFALFPSASFSWDFREGSELRLNYSRRIHRPFGPQLNTFENIADPSEVHLGNPLILPEYSNSVELSYLRKWTLHTLSATAYLRANTDMISHVSFLAPMASDPNVNTMYYGHANVGNMTNTGVEIISRNTLFGVLTLTSAINLYNSHLKGWSAEYPLHGELYSVRGSRQDRFVCDLRCMVSMRLPWDLTLQATGRYNSRCITSQGSLESDWDVEAGVKRNFGKWGLALLCKDIFDSKKTHNILYGNGYTQSISKWTGGRTLRLSLTYNFGKSNTHGNGRHNHIDTGGYGEEHHH